MPELAPRSSARIVARGDECVVVGTDRHVGVLPTECEKGTSLDRPPLTAAAERLGRLSRRSTLHCLGAGLAAAALRSGPAMRFAAAQTGPLPDLTGVAPLPLTDERLATFEAYVAA